MSEKAPAGGEGIIPKIYRQTKKLAAWLLRVV